MIDQEIKNVCASLRPLPSHFYPTFPLLSCLARRLRILLLCDLLAEGGLDEAVSKLESSTLCFGWARNFQWARVPNVDSA